MVSEKYCYAIHELRLHQNDRLLWYTKVVTFRSDKIE